MNRPTVPLSIPAISLVIPTHNRAESLARTLQAIENIEVPDSVLVEIVVVLDGCTDHSKAIVNAAQGASRQSVVVIATEGLGAGGARNRGIQRSSGNLIAFIDDDVIPEPSWLKHHLACHREHEQPLVSVGAMTLPSSMRLPPWNEWEVLSLRTRYEELATGAAKAEPTDLYTANAMVPKEALVAVGGFDESLKRAEDVELAGRLANYGLNFVFLTGATVAHCPVRSLKDWKKIPVNYANSHIEMQNNGPPSETKRELGAPKLDNMHGLTRTAVKLFSKRTFSSEIYCFVAQTIGQIAHAVRLQKISYAAFSSVYNVLYFGTLHRKQLEAIKSKGQ